MAGSLILLLLCILNPAQVLVINAVSFNESCTSGASSCRAILAYRVTDSFPVSLGNISTLFSVNASDLLAANGFSPDADLSSQLSSNETVRVILPCPCVGGLRTGLGVINYTIISGDGLYIISQKFGGFVNYTEIANANGLPDPDKIEAGKSLTIPYPCSCLENKFNDRNVLFMSYVVHEGESPAAFSRQYNISLSQYERLNPDPAPVIRLPVQSCKASFNKDSEDGELIVPSGGYATTANGCVQCSCINAQMYCTKSPSAPSACAVKCQSSSLEIGNFSTSEQGGRCIVDSCLYNGYSSNGTIFTRIQKNTTEADCAGVGAPPTFAYAPEEQGVPEAIAPPSGGLTPSPQPNTPSVPTSGLAPPPQSGSTPSHVNMFMLILIVTVMFFVLT